MEYNFYYLCRNFSFIDIEIRYKVKTTGTYLNLTKTIIHFLIYEFEVLYFVELKNMLSHFLKNS